MALHVVGKHVNHAPAIEQLTFQQIRKFQSCSQPDRDRPVARTLPPFGGSQTAALEFDALKNRRASTFLTLLVLPVLYRAFHREQDVPVPVGQTASRNPAVVGL